MKYDWEPWKTLCTLFKHIKTKRRRYKDTVCITCTLRCFELVRTVRCPDSDRKRITACLVYELLNLFRTCITLLSSLNNYFILNACKCSKLSLNYNAVCVRILNNLLGQRDIILE